MSPEAEVNHSSVHDVIDIKQEVSYDDATEPCAGDFCTQPTVKLVPVNDSKQWIRSGMNLPQSYVRKEISENPFQCNECDAKFPSVYKLRTHVMNKHKRRDKIVPAYCCGVCSHTLHDAGALRHHVLGHFSANNGCDDMPLKLRNVVSKNRHIDRKLHKCSVCHETFKHSPSLRRHVQQKHDGTESDSYNDSAYTVDVSEANLRKQRQKGVRRRACEICGKLVSNICQHKRIHRPESRQSKTCKICGVTVIDIRRHMQTHGKTEIRETRSKPRPCEVCGKVVADLYKHRKTHTKQTPKSRACDICGKVVVDLYRHRRVHSGRASQSQSCNICGKLVVDMYKHKLVHRGIERPLRMCTVCGKSVKDLHRHRQIHAGIRRSEHCEQPCEICGKIVANIRVHLKTHGKHGEEHQCPHCSRSYGSDKSLKEHVKTHSAQKNFICAECGKRYNSKTALSNHMWIHSARPRHQCSVCDKAFRWQVTWKRHLWTHGIGTNKTHNCPVCTKYFASPYLLRDHMRTHSGEKPYMCSQCGRRFGHRSSLLSHLKCAHSNKKSKCSECGRSIRAARMTEHLRSMHSSIQHKCPHCYLEFRQQDWLDWHIQCHCIASERYICEDCSDSNDTSLLEQFTEFPGICS